MGSLCSRERKRSRSCAQEHRATLSKPVPPAGDLASIGTVDGLCEALRALQCAGHGNAQIILKDFNDWDLEGKKRYALPRKVSVVSAVANWKKGSFFPMPKAVKDEEEQQISACLIDFI